MSRSIDEINTEKNDGVQDRQAIWMALSDLFVDNEISYESIAERVAHISIAELQHILFYEVAPVCMSNLLVLSPLNNKGFTEGYVIPRVQQHIHKMENNSLYRQKVRLKAKFYRVFLKQDWFKILEEICQLQAKSVNTDTLPTLP